MSDESDRKDHPLPGSVSDQNGEEAEPGHAAAGGGGDARSKDAPRDDGKSGDGDGRSGGEAGEGSQSTGNPDSAG